MRLLVLLLAVSFNLVCAGAQEKRAVRFGDTSETLRPALRGAGVDERNFAEYIAKLNEETRARRVAGENEHLIYFVLQSNRFTSEPRIEPALSAYEFVERLPSEERGRYLDDTTYRLPVKRLPAAVAKRFKDFVEALRKSSPATSDRRLAYFKNFLHEQNGDAASPFDYLSKQYERAMRFLYLKEFQSGQVPPQEIAAYVARLYRTRGHSTDTAFEANFAVRSMLEVHKYQAPQTNLNNVLIVGPGMDFAPRTDLLDRLEPQSYQPFAVIDALLNLKLADPERLRVHCVDINKRVTNHLRDLHGTELRLAILSGIADTERRPLAAEYQDYFSGFGRSIGTASPLDELPAAYRRHLRKSVLVRKEITERISADEFNIITERYEPSPEYDLVVVTNVFPYFNAAELLLALANIRSMMRAGGYLIHNEPRELLFTLGAKQDLETIHARTVLLATGAGEPLYDYVWMMRKK